MPKLSLARREAYAGARAEGLSPKAACVRAGLSPTGGYSGTLRSMPEVVARVEELTTQMRRFDEARLEPMIDKLMELAEKAATLTSASGLNTARGLLVAAAKLRQQLDAQSFPGEDEYEDIPPRVSEEEWLRKYAAAR